MRKKRSSSFTDEQQSILNKIAELSTTGREANANNYSQLSQLFMENPWIPESILGASSIVIKVGRDITEGKSLFDVLREKVHGMGRRL